MHDSLLVQLQTVVAASLVYCYSGVSRSPLQMPDAAAAAACSSSFAAAAAAPPSFAHVAAVDDGVHMLLLLMMVPNGWRGSLAALWPLTQY